MTCFCNSSYKIVKNYKGPKFSMKWVYGNFHKHLNKHLSANIPSDSCSDNLVNNNPKSNGSIKGTKSSNQTLLKYISRTTLSKAGHSNEASKDTEKHTLESRNFSIEAQVNEECTAWCTSQIISSTTSKTESKTLSLKKSTF